MKSGSKIMAHTESEIPVVCPYCTNKILVQFTGRPIVISCEEYRGCSKRFVASFTKVIEWNTRMIEG